MTDIYPTAHTDNLDFRSSVAESGPYYCYPDGILNARVFQQIYSRSAV